MKLYLFLLPILFACGNSEKDVRAEGPGLPCDPNEIAAYGFNGVPHRCDKNSKTFVVDEDAINKQVDYDRRKRELAMALQTRVLTEAEMQEVMMHGKYLFTQDMVPYFDADIQREFNEAILQQYRIRALKEKQ